MSRFPVQVSARQNPPTLGGQFALYRRTPDLFYYATVVRIFEEHKNGDNTTVYPLDAQCRLMNENEQALCQVPVYDIEAKMWQKMEQLLSRQQEPVTS